ncbi:phosphomannomutase/phosphoglucomutase [bacterium]|nr:phosphomannomutase/phosphoglucomutase [bacterium]
MKVSSLNSYSMNSPVLNKNFGGNVLKTSAFGKNDIRGIYGKDITEELFQNIGRGFTKWLENKTGKSANNLKVTVATDVRLSSPALKEALIAGLTASGVTVLDIGAVPTPLGYYSEFALDDVSSAMIITASHNPSEYNGLKMTFNRTTLEEDGLKEVKEYTEDVYSSEKPVKNESLVEKFNIIPKYKEYLVNLFGNVGKGVKVVTDCANATAGVVAPQLYKELGCEVVELYTEPDGRFPNHHPNPSVLSTLKDLQAKVLETKADVGIAFDGDSDRIGVVTNDGKPLTGDKLLLIYAQDILNNPQILNGEKLKVVSEVKSSQVLFDAIDKQGGEAIISKTGHGYIKSKMRETGAQIGGEMSGHTFFKDRYFGFDDAIYAGCRIIEIISKNKKTDESFSLLKFLKPFDNVFTSQEVRYPCPNENKKEVLQMIKDAVSENKDMFGDEIKDINTLDGMRIIFDGGFALIRQSNTEPVFTLRFEGKTEELCEQYQKALIDKLDECVKKVNK